MATPEDKATSAAAEQAAASAPNKKPKKAKPDAAHLAAIEEQLATALQAQADTNDQLLRTAAEYDNYRRRSQKEREAAFNDGVGHAVLQLLPVLDTLEAAANTTTDDQEYKKGVLMTLSKCEEIFKKLGIEEIESLGLPFDPELHNACMQQPADGAESGSITLVVQKGYRLGERVVRHAMVAVAP